MSRAKRDVYREAKNKEGYLMKKSTQFFHGWQRRYFKIIQGGDCLIYFEKMVDESNGEKPTPSGIFDITKMEEIKDCKNGQFTFKFGKRKF